MRELPILIPMALSLIAASTALANNYTGSLSDDTTGPIPLGTHVMSGACSIPAGKTLTIAPGAILKFTSGSYLALDGKAVANGTGTLPITFTSYTDDSAGGDTNGDGASSGTPGFWYGILARTTGGASSFNHVTLRYAGFGSYGAIQFEQSGCDITLSNSTIRDAYAAGLNLNNTTSNPQVSGCAFLNNGGRAVDNARIDSIPKFTNNTAAGNGGNHIRIGAATPNANRTIGPANCLNGALFIDAPLVVPAGLTVTLQAGTVLKFNLGGYVTLDGTMVTTGSAGAPVVFTSYVDDSIAGDTNNDGVSVGSPGYWYGIIAHTGGAASSLDRAELRYCGYSSYGAIHVAQDGSNFSLTNSTIRNSYSAGINFNNTSSSPHIANCSFLNNSGRAIDNARLSSAVNITNNLATGNAGNHINVTSASVAGSLTLGPSNCLGGGLVFSNPLIVQSGATLNLQAGTVLKFAGGQYAQLDGVLNALGTANQPAVFTASTDDSYGGDTNSDGPSVGTPAHWYGLIGHTGGAASVLDHAVIRYGGYAFYGGLHIEQAGCDMTLTNTTIRDCFAAGINMNGVASHPIVNYCAITNNGGVAVENARLDGLAGFTNDVVTGNGGNYIRVTNGGVSSDALVSSANCIGGAIVVSANVNVPLGVKLTLGNGAILKFQTGGYLGVHGALEIDGSALRPVVMTAFADDTVGGDTNNDGAVSLPAAGTWYGVEFFNSGTTVPSLLKHLLVRYTGFGFYPALICAHPLIGAVGVRAEHSFQRGIVLKSGGAFFDITAFNCGSDGVYLESGNAIVGRVTAAKCVGIGINAQPAFAGTVSSSAAFGNNGGNISGLDAGELRYSTGSAALAGSNGNINLDPKFADLNAGDLTLLSTSPCIDKGDPADTPVLGQDFTGVPRFLDGDLNYTRRVDMGAYEFDNVRLEVTGNLTAGGSMTIDVSGKFGMTALMFVGVAPGAMPLAPAGTLFLDLSQTWFMTNWGTVPSNLTFPIPNDFPPFPIYLQVLGTPGGGVANLSNPAAASIQ